MRIKGLAEATGVPVATLKYYLREGLLHPGEATAVNQAVYDDTHVRRVRLIRALADIGNMPLADITAVLAAVDDDAVPLHEAFGIAQDAMVPHRDRSSADDLEALAEVDAFIDRYRLHVRNRAEVRRMLADAVVALGRFGWPYGIAAFETLLPAAMAHAEFELSMVPDDAPRSEQMEVCVVGTIVFEVAAAAIRRLALEHASWLRFGPGARRRHPSGPATA